MAGNCLIAIGGLLPAFGGLLLRLGDPSFKYLGEMLGVALIFAGYLFSIMEAREGARETAASA